MRNELQLCLVRGGNDLDQVERQIRATLTAQHKAKLAALESEVTTARLILLGLKQPPRSPAYRMANSFMQTFRTHHQKEIRSMEETEQLVNELMQMADEEIFQSPTIDEEGRE